MRGDEGVGRLPAPEHAARWLLRWAWAEDAAAIEADLTAETEPTERVRWASVLGVVLHGLRPSVRRDGRLLRELSTGPLRRLSRSRLRPGLALKLAARGLRRDPLSSSAIVAILALGLAAPTVFFSLLWGGGLRPLPLPDGRQVVRVDAVSPRTGRGLTPTIADWRTLPAAAGLQGLEGFVDAPATIRLDGWGTLRLARAELTPGALSLLGVLPAVGRVPEPEEGLLLGWSTWQTTFDGDPDVIGAPVQVDGAPMTIAGVMPEGFGFPTRHDAWTVLDPGAGGGERPLTLFGRLSRGGDPDLVALPLTAAWRARDDQRDPEAAGGTIIVREFTRGRGEGGEAALFFGLVVVGVALLIIASVNAAHLLLVRAIERVRLLGIQAALGAGRAQIALQLLLESILLTTAAGVAGLGLTWFVVDWIQRTSAENFGYWWMRMEVEPPVVLFALLLVLGTAALAGLLPIVRVLRLDLQQAMKTGRAAAGREGWSQRVLTTGQLALSCTALTVAGLTSLSIATAADFGADLPADEVVLGSVALPSEEFVDEEARRLRRDGLESALAVRLPGRRLAVANSAPGYLEPGRRMRRPGLGSPDDPPEVVVAAEVGEGYFDLFDIGLVRGRTFTPADDVAAPPVAIVNTAWVERWAAGRDPLSLDVVLPATDSVQSIRIVGVVETVRVGLGDPERDARLYLPVAQRPVGSLLVLARSATDPVARIPELRRTLAEIDPGLALSGARTLEEGHAFMTRAQRTLSSLAAGGGWAGLAVAAAGLYGLLAFHVRSRRRELGVRLSMGADGLRLGREVVQRALRQLLPATAIGLGLAWLGAPVLGGILLGLNPREPAVYAGVAAVFLGVGVLASLRPALTASRVRPAEILRED